MGNQVATQRKPASDSGLHLKGALVRIGASSAGCATVGAAIGYFFGDNAGSAVGALVGGFIGLAASVTDTIRSSKSCE